MAQKNSKYRIEGNKVLIDSSEIIFDFTIKECIEIGDMLIVHLDLYDKVIPIDENVFGVTLIEKRIKWQIEKRKYPGGGGYPEMRCPFTGISFQENKLRLHNWCSTNLIVDPITGKVLGEEQTK
jgi:hypothetical protein